MFYRFALGLVQGQAAEADAVVGVDELAGQFGAILVPAGRGDALGGETGQFAGRLAGGADQSLPRQKRLETAVEVDAAAASPAGGGGPLAQPPPKPPPGAATILRPISQRAARATASGSPTCTSQPPTPCQRAPRSQSPSLTQAIAPPLRIREICRHIL